MTETTPVTELRGPIQWMAQHPVAANLLMAALIAGGLFMGNNITVEVFPEFQLDIVTVQVPYPAASPEEVERGIVLAIEEAVEGLDGIKKITSSSVEGSGNVTIELIEGTNPNRALADIKNAVDRIQTFPNDAEDPVVSLVRSRRQVISLVIYGQQSERVLRALAERARDDLLQRDEITQVELSGVRPPEIGVEISQERLRSLDLTLEQVARVVGSTAVEVAGGGVKTSSGEVLLRTAERRDEGEELQDVPVVATGSGAWLELQNVARRIDDSFRDTDQSASFNGRRAVLVDVYRTGDETPIEIAAAVKEYAEELRLSLPDRVGVDIWRDQSRVLEDRMDLLMRNAWLGLILVLLVLGLFLEMRLAFWVTMGIPISFLGSLLLGPVWGVSINMITLFAFIVTLGMVVDDAIVVGENVYYLRKQGRGPMSAAIEGARQVAVPVTFAILTSVAAFSPMFFVPGFSGKIFYSIPAIVVSVLVLSLVESLFILPAHLGHLRDKEARGIRAWILRAQSTFSNGLEWLIERTYRPLLRWSLTFRYVTAATAVGLLMATVGFVAGGFIRFEFLPNIDSDTVASSVRMPFGIDVDDTERVRDRIIEAARTTLRKLGTEKDAEGIFANIGSPLEGGGPPGAGGGGATGSHLANVVVQLVPTEEREFTARQFVDAWREEVGRLPVVETLTFSAALGGPSAGAAIDVQLSHRDTQVLETAAGDLARRLARYPGVTDVDPGYSLGKPQLDLTVTAEARAKGITAQELGRQVRAAFYGAEALRQQRGRDELRILVRLPAEQRRSEFDIESLVIRTPAGGEMMLSEAAHIERGRAYTEIKRSGGARVVNVTADVVQGVANANEVMETVAGRDLPEVKDRYQGLAWSVEGERKEQMDSMKALGQGFGVALLLIFALLAIPFRSYSQPLIVMSAIPFGIIGAIGGHLMMGFNLSVISIMGIVALSGIVVNDSLVLVDAINERRAAGMAAIEAVVEGGVRRFRPILLTSLTTFFGLAPMILETSVQARFLIPMALSLGFGVLFATFVILLLVPAGYVILEDIKNLYRREENVAETTLSPPTPAT